jgi:hypothetical protein
MFRSRVSLNLEIVALRHQLTVVNRLERRPPVPLTLRQVDPLIRQLTLYRNLIDRRTGDSE